MERREEHSKGERAHGKGTSVSFPGLARGGKEHSLYLGLRVLEASEARFVSGEPGLASTQPCSGKNEERRGWMGTRDDSHKQEHTRQESKGLQFLSI